MEELSEFSDCCIISGLTYLSRSLLFCVPSVVCSLGSFFFRTVLASRTTATLPRDRDSVLSLLLLVKVLSRRQHQETIETLELVLFIFFNTSAVNACSDQKACLDRHVCIPCAYWITGWSGSAAAERWPPWDWRRRRHTRQ